LGQTFCHDKGRFRATSAQAWNTSNEELVREWELKLIYLAIHSFHHQPVLKEHQERKACQDTLPPYEYQCANAKYIVTDLPNLGMGTVIRLSSVAHVLMGIASDRIPLFIANSPEGPAILQAPWKLASCDRRDLQCVFLPTTPCTLITEDLVNATILEEVDVRSLRQGGLLPNKFDNEKVVIAQARVTPAKYDKLKGIHIAVRKKVHHKVMELIDEWKSSSSDVDQQKLQVLQEAAKRIKTADQPDPYDHYEYGHR
jgi:hypothetical protein